MRLIKGQTSNAFTLWCGTTMNGAFKLCSVIENDLSTSVFTIRFSDRTQPDELLILAGPMSFSSCISTAMSIQR